MKQPTITKAVAHALTSRKAWAFVAKMWLGFVAAFVVLTAFGVASGARVQDGFRYLGEMVGFCSVAVPLVGIAHKSYYGYRAAQRAWHAQRRTRRAARAMLR